MGEVKWTKEQSLAINEKGQNILVAAAAGSGKTAVLVERIIRKILNDKIDIDKILVVTFTKAAASEMRERILKAIYKEIEIEPNNEHLQKQITLISKASICTIDSFCLDVVKNNFFEIGISPNLKIAENTEIEILKQEILEEIFESKYENQDEDFLELIDTYTSYRGDEVLKDIILEIYKFIQSTPFPKKWLKEKMEMFNLENVSFEKTTWGKVLMSRIKDELEVSILKLENELDKLKYEENVNKIIVTLSEDIRKIRQVYELKTWDEVYEGINNLSLDKFSADKNTDDEIKDKIKKMRNKVRESIKSIIRNIMIYNSEEANSDTKGMYNILSKIEKLVLEFSDEFSKAKQDRNIMDFNDSEHFALEILSQESTANKYREKYEEILIDEYQDSNLVQEYILSTISRKNNIFMVGDVKQSIYKFRQARPELFLEKYENYKLKDNLQDGDDLKIQLFKNFRSRENVLLLTNIVFDNIMSRELGDIDYKEEEYLNLGAEYPEGENLDAELDIIDLKEQEEIISDKDSEDEEEVEKIEDILIEAKLVAKRIRELIDTGFMVCNKDKTYRKITYKDIAVLLRSTQYLAPIYEQEISKLGIPVFSDTSVRILRFCRNTSYNEFTKNNR